MLKLLMNVINLLRKMLPQPGLEPGSLVLFRTNVLIIAAFGNANLRSECSFSSARDICYNIRARLRFALPKQLVEYALTWYKYLVAILVPVTWTYWNMLGMLERVTQTNLYMSNRSNRSTTGKMTHHTLFRIRSYETFRCQYGKHDITYRGSNSKKRVENYRS